MTVMDSPPYYLLYCHSSFSGTSASLGHPNIQYHYADDSPLNILPRNDEHVLVMDLDPCPTVKSLSKTVAVSNLKVEDAPAAAAAAEDGDPRRNDKMYIIEFISPEER